MSIELLDQPEEVGARLELVLAGHSHSELARRLGMSTETIRRSRSRGKVSLRLVQRLASEFNVSPLWLLIGRGPTHIEPPLCEQPTTVLLAELGSRMDRLIGRQPIAVLTDGASSPP